MKSNDHEKFAEIMAGLQELFVPEKPISHTKIELYFRHFSDWNIDQFSEACNNVLLVKKISTFPLPAEIREAGTADAALAAWLLARRMVGKYGSGLSIIFPDPIIHSCVDAMGGWLTFCNVPDDEKIWKQREFERLYNILKDKPDPPTHAIGTHDLGIVDLRKDVEILRISMQDYLGQGQIEHDTPHDISKLTEGIGNSPCQDG